MDPRPEYQRAILKPLTSDDLKRLGVDAKDAVGVGYLATPHQKQRSSSTISLLGEALLCIPAGNWIVLPKGTIVEALLLPF
jgi:hypothetical protein